MCPPLSAGKGRGLETTKSISTGELLMVSTALAVTFEDLELEDEESDEGSEEEVQDSEGQAQPSGEWLTG